MYVCMYVCMYLFIHLSIYLFINVYTGYNLAVKILHTLYTIKFTDIIRVLF